MEAALEASQNCTPYCGSGPRGQSELYALLWKRSYRPVRTGSLTVEAALETSQNWKPYCGSGPGGQGLASEALHHLLRLADHSEELECLLGLQMTNSTMCVRRTDTGKQATGNAHSLPSPPPSSTTPPKQQQKEPPTHSPHKNKTTCYPHVPHLLPTSYTLFYPHVT